MRLFEMLLVLSCFALLIDLLFFKRIAPKTGIVTCIASTVILRRPKKTTNIKFPEVKFQ